MAPSFSALIMGATFITNITLASAGSNDTYSCDAFAEYYSDADGSRSVQRRKWPQISYKIATIGGTRDRFVLVFSSGDTGLDQRYRDTAPLYSGTANSRLVLDWMAKQPANLVLAEARSKSVAVPIELRRTLPALRSKAICWRNGDTPPDLASWPNNHSPTLTTCREWSSIASAFVDTNRSTSRVQCKKELHAIHLITGPDGAKEHGSAFTKRREESNLCGPVSHAEAGVEAALRRDAEAAGEYQLLDYGGACN